MGTCPDLVLVLVEYGDLPIPGSSGLCSSGLCSGRCKGFISVPGVLYSVTVTVVQGFLATARGPPDRWTYEQYNQSVEMYNEVPIMPSGKPATKQISSRVGTLIIR